jgi:acyl-coenzyme A thioesterase PaaI-like protein
VASSADADRYSDRADHGGDQVARAVASVRRVAGALVRAGNRTDLSEIAERIHAVADDVETRVPSALERLESMEREGRGSLYSPVVGTHNAIAPPVALWQVGGGTEGSVSFSVVHERASGVVHEGVVALVLDVALANANAAVGMAGMTAQLDISFHQPVPVEKELAIRSRHERIDGRKIYSCAEVWLGDELLVSADGLFISTKKQVSDV